MEREARARRRSEIGGDMIYEGGNEKRGEEAVVEDNLQANKDFSSVQQESEHSERIFEMH